MAFVLECDRMSSEAFRDAALEQITKSLQEADPNGGERSKAIHSVRKRCKRLRGLLRLVRSSFPEYRQENAALRAAANGLGPFRDADVLTETFEKLIGSSPGTLDEQAIAKIRLVLSVRSRRLKQELDEKAALAEFRKALDKIRRRAEDWELEDEGWAALQGGFERVYRSARRDYKMVKQGGSAEAFHDWRKQVKYHFYHLCLLRRCAPDVLGSQREVANELGETLGEQHDVAVFMQVIHDEAETFGKVEIGCLGAMLKARQEQLGEQALQIGRRLFAERTGAIVERIGGLWTEAHNHLGATRGAGDRAQVSRAQ